MQTIFMFSVSLDKLSHQITSKCFRNNTYINKSLDILASEDHISLLYQQQIICFHLSCKHSSMEIWNPRSASSPVYWGLEPPTGRLWLGGRASVLLSEGHWFDSPGLHVEVSLGKILNHKTPPDVLVGALHGSHHHQVYECINHCKLFWTMQ